LLVQVAAFAGSLSVLATLLAGAGCGDSEPPPPLLRLGVPRATPAVVAPAAGLAAAATGTAHDGVPDAELAGWARDRASPIPARVTLQEIALYGEADGGAARDARQVRVVLRFDGVAVYRRGELPAEGGLPRRLVLDLDGVALGAALPPVLHVGRGGLQRIRAFVLDGDRVRVSFDVEASSAYRLFFLDEPFRVVMDFRREQRAQRAGGARAFTVALDPGHGGEQPGAKGPNGLKESQVALAIARRVRQSLRRQAPEMRVVMTRDEDRFVSLDARAAIANAVDADLFVSIHLNASPSAEQGGLATFVLDTTDDQAALRLAARENDMALEGVSRLQFILASLYRSDQVQRSRALAEDVQRSSLHAARRILPELEDRGVKSALFYVLVGAHMPAILVEGSFITRPREAEALATDEYRQVLADGIAEGILRHLQRKR
jgi:N-acetylmuramoyl-L-alanine amidase